MKLLQRTICAVTVLISITSAFPVKAADKSISRNAINLNPVGMAFGAIGGNYEYLAGKKHGLMTEGSFAGGSDNGVSAGLQYRYHYFPEKKHKGLNSPFWGPFVYYEKGGTEVKDENGAVFTVDIEYCKAGINWGRRWLWKNGFNTAFRVGYGLPLYVTYAWSPEDPKQAEMIENLTTAIAGIDGEFSIGYAF